jgi:hypothetical protein
LSQTLDVLKMKNRELVKFLKNKIKNSSFKVKHFAKTFLKKKPAPYEHYLISRSMYLKNQLLQLCHICIET